MLAEANLDQVRWEIGPKLGCLLEQILVAMDALVVVLVGVDCGGRVETLGCGALVHAHPEMRPDGLQDVSDPRHARKADDAR